MQLAYTKTIAAKLLKTRPSSIKKIEAFVDRVYVEAIKKGVIEGFELMPEAFEAKFFETRRKSAKNVVIRFDKETNDDKKIVARAYSGTHLYYIDASPQEIRCQCEDYHQQSKHLEQPICKHVYAYLALFQACTVDEYSKLIEHAKTYDQLIQLIAF